MLSYKPFPWPDNRDKHETRHSQYTKTWLEQSSSLINRDIHCLLASRHNIIRFHKKEYWLYETWYHMYTVFKSKWHIVNLCSSETTSLKAFKFSVNVGNNWPFCHVQTRILILNSLGSAKQTKYAQFSELNFFSWFIWKDLSLSMYRCQKNWARTPGLVSNDRKFFRNYTFT